MDLAYDGGSVSTDECVRYGMVTGAGRALFEEIVKVREGAREARRLGFAVDDVTLQNFVDRFRASHGLHSAAATLNYLDRAGFDVESFERLCEEVLLSRRFEEELLAPPNVRQFVVEQHLQFDTVAVRRIVVNDGNLANELRMRIEEDEEDFATLAAEYSKRPDAGAIVRLRRSAFPADVAARLFQARPGTMVGPFETDEGYELVKVDAVLRASADDEGTCREARALMLHNWLQRFCRNGFAVKRREER